MVKRIYLLVLAAFALTLSAQNKEQENNAIRKLGIAQYAISHLYVDSVNAMKLTEGAITGMLTTRSALHIHRCGADKSIQ